MRFAKLYVSKYFLFSAYYVYYLREIRVFRLEFFYIPNDIAYQLQCLKPRRQQQRQHQRRRQPCT